MGVISSATMTVEIFVEDRRNVSLWTVCGSCGRCRIQHAECAEQVKQDGGVAEARWASILCERDEVGAAEETEKRSDVSSVTSTESFQRHGVTPEELILHQGDESGDFHHHSEHVLDETRPTFYYY